MQQGVKVEFKHTVLGASCRCINQCYCSSHGLVAAPLRKFTAMSLEPGRLFWFEAGTFRAMVYAPITNASARNLDVASLSSITVLLIRSVLESAQ